MSLIAALIATAVGLSVPDMAPPIQLGLMIGTYYSFAMLLGVRVWP